jgi:predicted DNA-binding protein (UPF0251 family)
MKWVPLNEHRLVSAPVTEWERMMQHGDPDLDETIHIEIVEHALHNMDESMQDVLRAIFYEQIPYSELGERLGCSKTQAWRKAQAAINTIKTMIGDHPILTERYNVTNSWDEAAHAVVTSYDDSHLNRQANIDLVDYCIDVLRTAVNDHEQPPSFAFNTLGIEAVAELKSRNQWNPDEFCRFLCGKQHDYGHGNINAFGLVGLAVRLSDKVARLHNLNKKFDAKNESLLDTWNDIVGYAVIAEMIFNNTFNLELEPF